MTLWQGLLPVTQSKPMRWAIWNRLSGAFPAMRGGCMSLDKGPCLIQIGHVKIRKRDETVQVVNLDAPILERHEAFLAQVAQDAVHMDGAQPQGVGQVVLRQWTLEAGPVADPDQMKTCAQFQKEMCHPNFG